MKATPTRAEFIALPIEQRAHYLVERGGVKVARTLLKEAVRADAADDVDALRHAVHALIPMSPNAAFKLAKKYADQGLTERAWRKDAFQIALRQPELGLSLVQGKKLPWDKYLRAFPSLEVARPHAETLMVAQITTAKDILDIAFDTNIALDWTLAGHLSAQDFLHSFQPASVEHVQRLFDNNLLTAEEWLAYGNIPANVLLDYVAQNKVSVVHCLKKGWIPEGAAAQWIDADEIDARTYVMFANVHWNNTRPLNRIHVEFATSFATLPLLMDTIGVMVANWNQVESEVWPYAPQGTFAKPAPTTLAYNSPYSIRPNAPEANAYARRLIAAYFQGPQCYVEAATPPGEASETFACSVCMEDLPLDKARKPAACTHAADICVDCAKQAVELQPHLKCPSGDCETVLTPNDILTFGMGGEQADAWALKLVKAMSRGERDWETCATADCVGGIRVPRGEQFVWTCVCCSETQATSNYIVDLAADKTKILSLIDDLRGGSMNGKQRECYHCGFICEHINGCEAMTCGGCYKPWSFNRGSSHTHGTTGQAQTFVPYSGLMVRAGLYDGLEPGQTNVDPALLQKTVDDNAIRLGLKDPLP